MCIVVSGGMFFAILFVFHILPLNSDTTFYIFVVAVAVYLDKVIGICGELPRLGEGWGPVCRNQDQHNTPINQPVRFVG